MSILTVIKQDQDCAIRILDNCGGNWQSVSKEIAKYRTEREAQAVQREREAAKGLVDMLSKTREIIALCHSGIADPDTSYNNLVKRLGEESGYGNLMATTSRIWAENTPHKGSNFTCGPCQATVDYILKEIDVLLATYNDNRKG
jgi:hypothetical protein